MAAAQVNGTSAAAILELPGSTRQAAFEGAYAAVVGDAGSVFVNPAGLAPIHRVSFGVSYERNPLGTTLSSAAAAVRIGHFDLGVGAMYLDLGGDSEIVPDPAFGGDRGLATGQTISAYDALAVGALAYRFGMFSVGGSAKFVQQSLGGGSTTSSGFTGDVGVAMALFDILAFGYSIQNVAGSISGAGSAPRPLPRTTRFGVTINIVDPQGTERLMLTTDLIAPPGRDSYWALGFEGGVVSSGVGFLGRAGIAAGRAPGDQRPFSVGAEIRLRTLRLEYAWQGFDALGAGAHRFGLRIER